MPIFEFECRACGHTFEKLLKESSCEWPCPSCGQVAKRVISLPAARSDSGCAAPAGSGFR